MLETHSWCRCQGYYPMPRPFSFYSFAATLSIGLCPQSLGLATAPPVLVPKFSGRKRKEIEKGRGALSRDLRSHLSGQNYRPCTTLDASVLFSHFYSKRKQELGIGVYWANLSCLPQIAEVTAQNHAQNSVVDFGYKYSSISFQPLLKSKFGVWGVGFTHLVF